MTTTARKVVYTLQAVYAGKGEVKQLNDDLKSLAKIEKFKGLRDNWARLNEEFVAAKKRMRELRDEMQKPGNGGMSAEYEKSVTAVNKLAAEIQKQKRILDEQRQSMKTAGVEVANLAGHYDKLKQSANSLAAFRASTNWLGVKSVKEVKNEIAGLVKAYRDIAGSAHASSADQARALDMLRKKTKELYATIKEPSKLDTARNILGLASMQSVVAEINKAKQAYSTLVASGKVSMAELARAKVALGQRIDELRRKTSSWREALTEMRGHALELAAAMAGIIFPSKVAIEFESAMADVRKTVDGTPEQIKALGDELKEMTRYIPLSAVELAKIAAAGGQLGISANDIGKFVQITAKMATAFNMSADEAGEAIGKLRNIFSLGMDEIASFGDAINQLGNTTAAKEKDIVEVLLRIGGTAQTFGLFKEQAAALAAAMLSLGKTPEVAATGINALLSKMQTATQQSSDFQTALGRIGMTANEMADAVAKNPQKAITDLLGSLAKLDNRDRAEVLTGLFGAEYQDDIAILVNSLQTYRDTLNQVGESSSFAGALTKEFMTRAGTTGNELVLLKNVLIEIVGNLGEGFLPLIKKGSEFLREILQPIASLTGSFPKLSAGFVAFGTGAMVFTTVTRLVDIAKMALTSFGVVGETSLGKVGAAAMGLGRIMKFAGAGFTSFLVGWEVGTLLRKFEVVEKAGISMAAGITKAWIRAKIAWTEMRGQDTSALVKELQEADRIYGEMFANVGKKAKETAEVQKKAQGEIAAATKQSVSEQQRVTGQALEEIKKKYREHASEIKRLQGEIVSTEINTDQQIRDMKRQTMSEPDAWRDKKKQAEEYAIVAKHAEEAGKQALEVGDIAGAKQAFETQKQYAEMAGQLFAQLGVKVEENGRIVSTQTENMKTATAGVEAMAKAKISALKGLQETEYKAMEELTKKSGLQDLSKGMEEAEAKWLKSWENMRAKAISELGAVEERIKQIVSQDRTVYINIKTTESRSVGGLIGAQRLATGGQVTRLGNMLRGGFFPGFGGGDRRHVIAEDGEYMLDKFRVKDAGLRVVRAFHAGRYDVVVAELMRKLRMTTYDTISRSVGGIINRMTTVAPIGPQYMHAGGQVVGAAAPAGNVFNLTVNYTGSAPRSDARNLAETVLRELERRYRRRSS